MKKLSYSEMKSVKGGVCPLFDICEIKPYGPLGGTSYCLSNGCSSAGGGSGTSTGYTTGGGGGGTPIIYP